jgi:lysozyme family protein
MMKSLPIDNRILRVLSRNTLLMVAALHMFSPAAAFASQAPAQSKPVAPAAGTAVDCDHLPTKDEFVKKDYDKETIRKIQQCLKAKGFFKAPASGVKGPLTIAALEKYQAQKKAAAEAARQAKVNCNALPSKEQFVKQEFDAEAIKIIQGCLSAQGYYKGAIDGKKGQALIDALAKSHAAGIALKSARVSCTNLPSQKAFIKGKDDRKSIVIIQGCLWEKGYYTGPIDGMKGPLTIAALGRLSGAEAAPVPTIRGGGPFVALSLTSNDVELLKAANDILDKLKELEGEEFESNDELKNAVQSAIKEMTDEYDKSLSAVISHVNQMKTPKLTEEDFKTFKEANVPDTVIGTLRELQDETFSEKSLLLRAVNAKLNEVSDPYRFLVSRILKDVNNMGANSLPAGFFADLETMRISEPLLKKLKQIQDVEYANSGLFVNALETVILNPMLKNEEINQASFDAYESLLLAKAAKEHLFDAKKQITWSDWSCGCYLDDFSGIVYGFYPFWNAGSKQKIDFSVLTRIGYFAVTFNEKGEIAELFDWQPDRAAFIDKAHQYRSNTDLVIYRNDWQNWSGFIAAQKASFMEKLTDSIVNAVTENVTDTAFEKVKRILSFGSSPLPSMGDGVTVFFEGYPEDQASIEFFRSFIRTLHAKLEASRKKLGIVLPLKSVGKMVELHGDVDFFLVLMEEPTKDTKKKLRQEVENLFKGEVRRSVLRKIVPVISPAGHDFDRVTEQQLKDDLIYFQDNFGGVGFWPLPTSRDSGAAELNELIKANFTDNTNQDFLQEQLEKNAPWFGKIVGPHRWGIRIAFDILLYVLLVYSVLALWVFELREFFRKHVWWFLGTGALTLSLQMCLFLWDPFWRGRTPIIMFAVVLLGAGAGALFYIRRIKQTDLP